MFVIVGSLLSKQDFTYSEDEDVENSVVCLPTALHCMAGCMLFFMIIFYALQIALIEIHLFQTGENSYTLALLTVLKSVISRHV